MSFIHAIYRLRATRGEAPRLAQALALEQSVEVPLEAVRDAFVRERIVARVEAVDEIGDELHQVRVALAEATTGSNCAQLLNMLFGNSSLHDHVELVDVELPQPMCARFGGPRFGIDGLRRRLGVAGRPLACAALKPQGLPSEVLAALCESFALAGVDVIKDDHGLADQAYSPFAERVALCQRAIERARRATGRRAVYAPSLVGSPKALAAQLRVVRDEGVGMVLVAPSLIGLPAFHELVADGLGVPVLAHPAFGGAARVAPPLLIGKLYRLLGADAVIFPNHGGRFSWSADTCAAIAAAARDPWHGLAAALPVPAGGMSVEQVPAMRRFYGDDAMLLIGGSLLVADDVARRTREFVAAVAAGDSTT